MKLIKAKAVITITDRVLSDDEYECVMIGRLVPEPAVRSKKTGKTFVMEWQDIIQKAIDAGVDTLEWEGADA